MGNRAVRMLAVAAALFYIAQAKGLNGKKTQKKGKQAQ